MFKTFWAALAAGGLFRTKPADEAISDADDPQASLTRVLGPVQLTLLGIGAIVGAGIFATIGTAAAGDKFRPGAGPGLMVSFVITAIVCGFTALCYAEFASMIPVSGSAYTYAYASLGELMAWIIGWDLIIEYAVGNIGVAISWANYFKTFVKGFGVHIPDWLSMDYRTAAKVPGVLENAPHLFGYPEYPVIVNLLAVGIVTLITVILVLGIRESAWFNAVMVGIKIIVLTFFIVIGLQWVQPANWGTTWEGFAPNGWAGISAGAAIVFFAYIGFDAVSTVAEETRNPQRNLPIGIVASLIICTIFYVVVSAVFTGLISYDDLRAKLATEQAEPLTMALEHANPHATWTVGVVAFGSVIAHTAVLLVFQLGQPRIFLAMARDGLLPPVFARVHPRFRTPHLSTILTGVFVAGFAAVASIDEMVDLTNIGTLFAFILVCAGILILRVKDPLRERRFRVPSGWTWTLLLYAGFAVGVVLLFLPLRDQGGSLETGKVFGIMGVLAVSALVFAISRNHIFPVLGVLSCLYLVYYLPPTSWLRFAAWLNIGFLIYVGYGCVHSHLTGRRLSERPAEHDAQTARAGTWLGLLSAALVVAMRAFDLWLQALKTHEDRSWWGQAWAALADVSHPNDWLPERGERVLDLFKSELFWFLLLPLGLNALVLCPTVIWRAVRAGRGDGSPPRTRVPVASVIMAVGLAAAILLYLGFAAQHSLVR